MLALVRRRRLARSARLAFAVFSASLAVAAATGCKGVKPRDRQVKEDPDSGTTIGIDASGSDAAPPSCALGTLTCPAGTYCAPSDQCLSVTHACLRSGECAEGYACLSGTCARAPGSCDGTTDAGVMACRAPETCIAAGRCAPALSDDLRRLPRCELPSGSECGPGGVCRDGACVACGSEADCPDRLVCQSVAGAAARCTERSPCAATSECFFGNVCAGAICTRSTAGCEQHPSNHTPESAAVLLDSYYFARVCGPEPDWYTITVPPSYGARIVVTSTRTLSTVSAIARAKGKDQAAFSDVGSFLALPGITVIDVPAYHDEQAVSLTVAGNDSGGTYAIDTRFVLALCARDAFALYGNSDRTTAPVIAELATLDLRACTNAQYFLRTDVEAGDVLLASAAFGDGANLDLELIDQDGRLLAAGRSTSTTAESVTSPRFDRAQRIAIRVITQRAPTRGEPFTLSLRNPGARARACVTPDRIDLGSGGRATRAGNLGSRVDLGAPSCPAYASPGRNDALYAVVPPQPHSVLRASVRQTNRPSTSTVTIALLSKCEDDTTSIACDASPRPFREATITRELTSTAAVYLMISSDGPREDVAYALDVSVEHVDPPANNRCMQAVELPGSAMLDASTFGAISTASLEVGGVCGAAGLGMGPDRFYHLTLRPRERAVLEQLGPPGAAWPGVGRGAYLWAGPDCARLTRTCTQAASMQSGSALPPRLVFSSPHAAEYVVAVDGKTASDRAAYRLRAIREPDLQCLTDAECGRLKCDDYLCLPPPANDTCPGSPIGLVNGRASVQGSNGAASDDYQLTCGVAFGQPDVVYQLELGPGYGDLTARITDAAWDPVLEIRYSGCTSSTYAVACNDDLRYPENVLPQASVRDPRAGTYFIIVKSYEGKGPFRLEVEASR